MPQTRTVEAFSMLTIFNKVNMYTLAATSLLRQQCDFYRFSVSLGVATG